MTMISHSKTEGGESRLFAMEIPHPHDKNWYETQLKRLPPVLRSKAQQGYRQVWEAAYSAEPVAHKRSNAARRAANIRLREFIEKIFA